LIGALDFSRPSTPLKIFYLLEKDKK